MLKQRSSIFDQPSGENRSRERQDLHEKLSIIKNDLEKLDSVKVEVARRLQTVRDAVRTSEDLRLQERLREIEIPIQTSLARLFHVRDEAYPIHSRLGIKYRVFPDFVLARMSVIEKAKISCKNS